MPFSELLRVKIAAIPVGLCLMEKAKNDEQTLKDRPIARRRGYCRAKAGM